jgi:hypothetical protein
MDFRLTPAQEALQATVRAVAEAEFAGRAAKWDRTEEYPWENVKRLVDLGLMGMTIPKAVGGPGASVLDAVLCVEEVGKACAATARILVEGNFGSVGALIHLATPAQQARYVPMVLQGEKPAIAITEPEAGSAATDMTTRAVRDGADFVLNGRKHWITGAGISQLHLVFARFDGIAGADGVGALWVERGTPGFRVGRREQAMGLRGLPEAELLFEDCRVPAGNLVVGAGGFRKLMACYNGQRLGAATVALGVAQGAFDHALRYAQERRQFGRPIADFQGIQWMLADMHIQLQAARVLIHKAAADAGSGLPAMAEVAVAKTYASEMAIRVTNDALQIHGALGYSREMPLERMARDARMFAIAGGTAQVQRNLIAEHLLGRKLSQRPQH